VGKLEFDVRLGVGADEGESELPPPPETPDVGKASAVVDDLDLDHWLNETEATGATDRDAIEPPEPESPDDETEEKTKEKEKPVEVVGVWKKGHWKPTAVDPGQAAADALRDFFKRH